MKQIELIVSGYEFICPECNTFNKVIEVSEFITCSSCSTKFKVQDYYHAMGR